MASMFVDFTGAPIKFTGPGTVIQPITQAIDLGGQFRVLDLIVSMYSLTGTSPNVTVSILTSTQDAIEVPQWPSIGSFSAITTADASARASLVGPSRFVRYQIVSTGTSVVGYLEIKGYARTQE